MLQLYNITSKYNFKFANGQNSAALSALHVAYLRTNLKLVFSELQHVLQLYWDVLFLSKVQNQAFHASYIHRPCNE